MRRREQAAIAVSRFGLGARPGELELASADPVAWLLRQLEAPPRGPGGVSTGAAIREIHKARDAGTQGLDRLQRQHRARFRQELGARTLARVGSAAPFFERWVDFWSNHFTVSVRQPKIFGVALAFEREAIRPNALGRFAELLQAVVRHPAMLVYLDNQRSVGDDSWIAERAEAGLNENLAREVLELHTLGVDGGYGQDDVIALARLLTGWSVDRRPSVRSDGFRFYPAGHDEAPKELLGRRYTQGGLEEGLAALQDLAAHPATARHVARRLAQHFVRDAPPTLAVATLEAVYLESGGDLRALARALVELPEAWEHAEEKLRRPEDWWVACARAAGLAERVGVQVSEEEVGRAALEAFALMGNVPFTAPSPAGWPEEAQAWAGGEALLQRVEVAEGLARHLSRAVPDAAARAQEVLGARLSRRAEAALRQAQDPATALALLFTAPEMLRR